MSIKEQPTSDDGEVYRQAWPDSAAYISCGLPFPEACVKHVTNTFQSSKVYIIASGSLSRNTNHVERLQEALGEKVVGTRHGMQPHTLWSEILQITTEAKKLNADLLITLGAGSLTDGAKIIALTMANDAQTFDDLDNLHATAQKGEGDIQAPKVPIICIPTSLSGGEYNSRGGGSNDHNHRKYSFAGPTRGPSLVILDPELTKTTPDRWWLSTGIRAVDHCTETICSLQGTPQSEVDACSGLRLLVPGLLRCKKDPDDIDARFKCQIGAIEAMKGVNLSNVPMGASHAIGHQLGPLGVGHGETSCILLPAVCKYNQSVNAERQDIVKEALGRDGVVAAELQRAGLNHDADLGDMLDVIIRALGMPRTLQEFDIGGDKLDMLAEKSLHDRWIGTNPRPIKHKEQVMEILRMVKG